MISLRRPASWPVGRHLFLLKLYGEGSGKTLRTILPQKGNFPAPTLSATLRVQGCIPFGFLGSPGRTRATLSCAAAGPLLSSGSSESLFQEKGGPALQYPLLKPPSVLCLYRYHLETFIRQRLHYEVLPFEFPSSTDFCSGLSPYPEHPGDFLPTVGQPFRHRV